MLLFISKVGLLIRAVIFFSCMHLNIKDFCPVA